MLDSVLEAADSGVRADYKATTDSVPRALVIDDALDPDRPNPWEAAGHNFRPDDPTERMD